MGVLNEPNLLPLLIVLEIDLLGLHSSSFNVIYAF